MIFLIRVQLDAVYWFLFKILLSASELGLLEYSTIHKDQTFLPLPTLPSFNSSILNLLSFLSFFPYNLLFTPIHGCDLCLIVIDYLVRDAARFAILNLEWRPEGRRMTVVRNIAHSCIHWFGSRNQCLHSARCRSCHRTIQIKIVCGSLDLLLISNLTQNWMSLPSYLLPVWSSVWHVAWHPYQNISAWHIANIIPATSEKRGLFSIGSSKQRIKAWKDIPQKQRGIHPLVRTSRFWI